MIIIIIIRITIRIIIIIVITIIIIISSKGNQWQEPALCMQVACSSIKAGRVFYESEAGLPAANLKAPFTEFR